MKEFATLLVEKPEPGIAVLTLNRPERLNAMSRELVTELHECLSLFEEDLATRVVILTGAGRGFCSGTDLKDERRDGESDGASISQQSFWQRKIGDLVLHMRKIPQPIIAAVNGVAAGGGFSFSMAADIRIAAESARFIGSFINIGLSAGDVGSAYFLPRLVGLSRAAEILYTGRAVEAEEARAMGFVSRVVPDGEALSAAMDTARTLLGKSPFGLRMTKEILNHSIDAPSLEAVLYMENRSQSLAVQSGDFKIAAQAFKEKRTPVFPPEG